MNTESITVSMPRILRNFVEYKIRKEGYGTISEYIRELIRMDQRLELARQDEAIGRQSARVGSGPSVSQEPGHVSYPSRSESFRNGQ